MPGRACTHTHTLQVSASPILRFSSFLSLSLSLLLLHLTALNFISLATCGRDSAIHLPAEHHNVLSTAPPTSTLLTPTAHGNPPRCRQQNGLKNLSVAKHLRHVFNNVVYNVDFSPFSLPPPFAFHMDFHRMPFMSDSLVSSSIKKKNKMPLNLFYFGNFLLPITVNILRLPVLLCVRVCACCCAYVFYARIFQ